MRRRLIAGLSLSLLSISLACAQDAAKKTPSHEIVSNGGLLHTMLAAPVMGEPFSAVQVFRTNRALADGTHIAHSRQHAVARDAQGRVRVEQPVTNQQTGQKATTVFVMDPVDHVFTSWTVGGNGPKIASQFKFPANFPNGVVTAAKPVERADRPQPMIKTEDLGTDSLEGLMVTVTRTTTIVPAGRSGNDQPITKTHEVWTSPDLKLVLKEQWEDPRRAERTISLEQLNRADPDPSLFRPPPGYTVKNVVEALKEALDKLEETQQN